MKLTTSRGYAFDAESASASTATSNLYIRLNGDPVLADVVSAFGRIEKKEQIIIEQNGGKLIYDGPLAMISLMRDQDSAVVTVGLKKDV